MAKATPSRIIAGKKKVAEFCSHELAKQGASVLLCARRAKVVRKGRPYCTQHDPERNQAKTVKVWMLVTKDKQSPCMAGIGNRNLAVFWRKRDAIFAQRSWERVIPCTITYTTKGNK